MLPESGRLRSLVRGPRLSIQVPIPARLRRWLHWLSHQGPVRVLLIYRDTKAGD